MLKFLPLILLIAYSLAMWFFSSWRLRRELDANSVPLDHPRLTPLLKRLGTAMDLPPVNAHIYEIPVINGLAAPDGRIFVTRGFIDRMEAGEITPEEISSVIAHELGHVAHGHARRRMIDFTGQNVIRNVLMAGVGRYVPFIGPWLINLASMAFAARLSQRDEFEADSFATALMIRAGIGAEPQISLFEKMAKLSKGYGSTPAWLLSHPKPDRRIAAIRANRERWRNVS